MIDPTPRLFEWGRGGDVKNLATERVKPLEVESELRAALSGCTLVGEIDLDSLLAMAAVDVLDVVALDDPRRLDKLYPACLCVALVRHGAVNYQRNQFWVGFNTWGLPQYQVGTQFLDALSRLGLERFDQFLSEDKARRYVAHALVHAGFPRPAAVQVFRLLAESLRLGAGDGTSIVKSWRGNPDLMESLRRPARRFVELGGDLAADLVDRMVDVLVGATEADVDANSFGLPSHISAAFSDLNDGEKRVGQRRRLPTPIVIIEPGTGTGPTVVLPPVPQQTAEEWLVSTGQQKTRRRASASSEQAVEVHPSAGWSVVAQADGNSVHSFQFRGFGKNVYLFSPGGCLLDPPGPIRYGQVLVLAPATFECRVGSAEGELVAIAEEFPPLSGSWHRYSLRDVFVLGTSVLWVGPPPVASGMATALSGNDTAAAIIPIGTATDRPVLIGEPATGATWSGSPVFSDAPRVRLPLEQTAIHRWTVRAVSHTGESRQARASDLSPEGDLVSTGHLLGSGAWAGSITAYGPLGRDLRERCAVVPGLSLDIPDGIVHPDAKVTVSVSADVDSEGDGGPWVLSPPTDAAVVTFDDFSVEISVPRLLWCIRSDHTARTVFSNARVTIAADDLTSGVDDLLLVRGRSGRDVSLRLADGESVLQEAKPVRCGSHAIASLALKQFADTVRSTRSAALDLVVEVEGIQAVAARVLARYESRSISVESMVEGASTLVDVRFEENRRFRGRVARFWSVTRPWEPPVDVRIDDSDEGHALLLVEGRLPPGRYRVEVLVPDLWAKPQRPTDRARYGEVHIGTTADEMRRLAALDPDEPLTTLELLLDDLPRVVSIPEDCADKVAWHALLTLVGQLDAGDPKVLSTPTARVARQVLFTVPEAATRAFARAAETGEFHADLLRRTAIALVPDFLDCPSENRDAEVLASLWEFSPVLGAAADAWECDEEKAASCVLWRRYGGWDPSTFDREDKSTWPGHIQGLDAPILRRSSEQVREITDALGTGVPMLAPGGAAGPLLGWLESRWELGDGPFSAWRAKYRPLNDRRIRHGFGELLLDEAKEHDTGIVWARFAQDLLAAALAFIQAPDDSREAPLSLGGLWDAHSLVRPLTEQVLLDAIVVRRVG